MLQKRYLSLAGVSLLAGLLTTAASATGAAAAPAAPGAAKAGHPGQPGLLRLIRPGVHLVRPGGAVTGSLARGASSTNWSGYAATGGKYTKVSASWVQPKGKCSSGSQYSSFWVGLDGYGSSTVEQTGSEVDCSGGTAQYYSWYEMYPAYPVNFSNTVRPGDHFTGSVAYHGGGKYTLVLADTTRGWRHAIQATLSGAANSSAEVIAEAPSSTLGVLPLTDFGTVNFANSTVDGNTIGHYHPTKITMVNSSGQAEDSVSGLSSPGKFSATWLRSS
jgi:hypothetical protein